MPKILEKCSFEKCQNKSTARGLCNTHYAKQSYLKRKDKKCSHCERPSWSKGLCKSHWTESRVGFTADVDVLTTGEAARICNVSIRTMVKWIDSGCMRGYTLPNSKVRRILRSDLVLFLKQYQLPTKHKRSVVIYLSDTEMVDIVKSVVQGIADVDIIVVNDPFVLGKMVAERPAAVFVDCENVSELTLRSIADSGAKLYIAANVGELNAVEIKKPYRIQDVLTQILRS